MNTGGHDIATGIARIRAWGEPLDWQGYDPYDGLNSPLAPILSLGTPLGRRLVTQAVRRSPLNLRPFLGIRRAWNEKAIGLVASAYARLAAAGDDSARPPAERWLDWLVSRRRGGWGYHFDVQTRFFFYARDSPNTIATSFAAQALLDGALLLGEERLLEPAAAAARFLVEEMLSDEPERCYFRYIPGDPTLIHNANLLACAVLARTASALGGDAELEQTAERAATISLDAQRADGSWPYAESEEHGWVDNFHTGYVLEAIARCLDVVPAAGARLDRGIEYWERELFAEDGRPMLVPGRRLPLDAHSYAQAIETWVAVRARRPDALEHAARLAHLLLDDLLAPAGYVRMERGRRWASRVPSVRWSTAPTLAALAGLTYARSAAGSAALTLS